LKLSRRRIWQLAGAIAATPYLPPTALALDYPTRPVRIIVGFPPGGTADIMARLIGQRLSERLGQPFIIENRPGAAGNIATEAVVRAPADGYTLLLVVATNTINASLYDKLTFNFIRDIAPVAGLSRTPLVLEVNPTLPVHSVPEFIAYAKANSNKISVASFGTGTISAVAVELLNMMADAQMLHVPYRGSSPMLTDLLGGQVQAAFDNLPASIGHIRSAKLRALALSTASRFDGLPDTPTVGEFLPGFEASAWTAVGAPRGVPAEIIEKLNREISAGLADPKVKARFADLGGTVLVASPAELGQFIAEETEKWGKVVKRSGLKPD
jgi:tripartite-type tricarboxylate transporter receptor subunit TctC